MKAMKAIRILLLILIIIGIGLICTQGIWVPKLVEGIMKSDKVPVIIPADTEKPTEFTENDFEKLKVGTSYSDVEKKFGKPEKDIGSGIHIFVYTLSDGNQMLLGFPGLNSLMYVKHRLQDGTTVNVVPQ